MTLFPRRIPAALAAFSLLFTASLRASAEANPPEARATRWVQISAKNREDRSRIADAGAAVAATRTWDAIFDRLVLDYWDVLGQPRRIANA